MATFLCRFPPPEPGRDELGMAETASPWPEPSVLSGTRRCVREQRMQSGEEGLHPKIRSDSLRSTFAYSLAPLGLCCCCERGTAMVSLLCSMCSGLGGLSGCGKWAWLLHGRWGFSGPGIRTVSPELAGGFLTTGPQGKCLLGS